MSGSHTSGGKPLSLDDLVALNDEIAALVRAGIPLETGLGGLRAGSRALDKLADEVAGDLRRGVSLADAIDVRADRLPPAYRAIVTAGLKTGRLPDALALVSRFARSVAQTRRHIALALIYPGVVVLAAYCLFVFLLGTTAAAIVEVQQASHAPPRWWVEALLTLERTRGTWVWIPPALLVLGGLWLFASQPALGPRMGAVGTILGRLLLGRLGMLCVPWLAGANRDFRRGIFAELSAMLIDQRVPLDQALTLAGDAAGDPRLGAASRRVAENLRRGTAPGDAIQSATGFPPFMRWMIAAGAQQNALPGALRQLGEIYRRRAQSRTEWLRMVLPVLLAVVIGGTAVLLYALTLFYPLGHMLSDLAAAG